MAQEQTLQGTLTVKQATDTELRQALAYIYAVLGITNLPDSARDLVVLNYLRKHHSRLTLQQLREAFELAINNRLQIKEEELLHYNTFSPMYAGRILRAYRKRVFKPKDEPKQLKADPEHLFVEALCEAWEQDRMKYPYWLINESTYVFLFNLDLIRWKDGVMYGSDGYELFEVAHSDTIKKAAQASLKADESKEQIRFKIVTRKHSDTLERRSRKVAARWYFDTLDERDVDFKELIRNAANNEGIN